MLFRSASPESALVFLFGAGKGSGAAVMFFVLGVAGVLVCLGFYWGLRRFMKN